MGLIHHHQNRLRVVQHPKRLLGTQTITAPTIGVAILLDHRHHHTRTRLGQKLTHLSCALGYLHSLTCKRRRVPKLNLQIRPVGDKHNLELPQLGMTAHGSNQEHHGQALA